MGNCRSLVVAIGVLAAAVGCQPETSRQGDRPTPDDAALPQDQYAEVNGVSIHYLDWGGDGPLLLLVPDSGTLRIPTTRSLRLSLTDTALSR